MESLKQLLETNKCLKLILGAGNENIKDIEKITYVYAKAGFNLFDVSAKKEVIDAVRNAINKAESDAKICVSVGLQSDIHLLKAVINKQKCINCSKCSEICPQNAIYFEDEFYNVDEKKCIGCSKCTEICHSDAIILEHKYKQPHAMLLPILSEPIDCVEYHCSSSDTDMIIENWHKIKSIYSGLIGICLDRSKLGNDEIIKLTKRMVEDNKGELLIFQTDGKPISGGVDDYNSTLQAVAFAQTVLSSNLPVYVIISGGTNSKSSKLAKECDVKINGIALGSYARKIIKEYVNAEDFWDNEDKQNLAIQTAKRLASEILMYI